VAVRLGPGGAPAGLLLRLDDIASVDSGRAGTKAANAARLLRAGFPVPAGIVLTTTAFERFVELHGFDASTPADRVALASLPHEVLGDLHQIVADSGSTAMAVRSSAVGEDLPTASLAGRYETVLGVRGQGQLVVAIRRCWASAFSSAVCGCGPTAGLPRESMAVLIQELVDAEVAGVAFTANPVSGERRECIIDAVTGLGDRLVSGRASPDEWVVRDGQATRTSNRERVLDAAGAAEVAALARRVEAHFGTPQDVEWARAGGRLWVLQSRPITTLR